MPEQPFKLPILDPAYNDRKDPELLRVTNGDPYYLGLLVCAQVAARNLYHDPRDPDKLKNFTLLRDTVSAHEEYLGSQAGTPADQPPTSN